MDVLSITHSLAHNQKVDISGLNLDSVNLSNNQIVNVIGLKLPFSLKILDLSRNQIVDVSGLKLPPLLKILYLNNNRIVDVSRLKLPPLLKALHLPRNQIVSISGLNLPHSLAILYLYGNQIVDFTPLITHLLWHPTLTSFLFDNNINNHTSYHQLLSLSHQPESKRKWISAMLVLRCAQECPRLGTNSAIQKLPRELVRMMFSCFV